MFELSILAPFIAGPAEPLLTVTGGVVAAALALGVAVLERAVVEPARAKASAVLSAAGRSAEAGVALKTAASFASG